MDYYEIDADLFSMPESCYLAHCISADVAMGAGIATQFNKRFNIKNRLINKYGNFLNSWDNTPAEERGFVALEGQVFNLITKRNYWQKPTYTTITNAVSKMAHMCKERSIYALCMPAIGCGLDRLEWEKVQKIIQDAFAGMDIEITVCMKGRDKGISDQYNKQASDKTLNTNTEEEKDL